MQRNHFQQLDAETVNGVAAAYSLILYKRHKGGFTRAFVHERHKFTCFFGVQVRKFMAIAYFLHILLCISHLLHACVPPPTPRWGGPPGPGFRLHLRDGVPNQSRERVPQPATRGPQRAAHAEKHAAGDKVSVMDRLIRFCSLAVFIGCQNVE